MNYANTNGINNELRLTLTPIYKKLGYRRRKNT